MFTDMLRKRKSFASTYNINHFQLSLYVNRIPTWFCVMFSLEVSRAVRIWSQGMLSEQLMADTLSPSAPARPTILLHFSSTKILLPNILMDSIHKVLFDNEVTILSHNVSSQCQSTAEIMLQDLLVYL